MLAPETNSESLDPVLVLTNQIIDSRMQKSNHERNSIHFPLLYASATKTKNLNQVANKNRRAPGRSTVRAEGVSSGAVTCIKIGKHSAGERIQMLHHPTKSFSYTTASQVEALDALHNVILSNRKRTLQTITTERIPSD